MCSTETEVRNICWHMQQLKYYSNLQLILDKGVNEYLRCHFLKRSTTMRPSRRAVNCGVSQRKK